MVLFNRDVMEALDEATEANCGRRVTSLSAGSVTHLGSRWEARSRNLLKFIFPFDKYKHLIASYLKIQNG